MADADKDASARRHAVSKSQADDLAFVGRVNSFAMQIYCEGMGLDTVPYPFMATPQHSDADAIERDRRQIVTMLQTDPPRELTEWIRTIWLADVSLQLYGVYPQSPESDRKFILINAVRRGDVGFVAVQQPRKAGGYSGDIVVYRAEATRLANVMIDLTPYVPAGKLGETVLVPGSQAARGSSRSVVESGTRPRSADQYNKVATTLSAFAQIHPGRSIDWGYQESGRHVHWAHKEGDGQYLIDRGNGRRAVPASHQDLINAVNRQIGHVVRSIREQRSVT